MYAPIPLIRVPPQTGLYLDEASSWYTRTGFLDLAVAERLALDGQNTLAEHRYKLEEAALGWSRESNAFGCVRCPHVLLLALFDVACCSLSSLTSR